MKYSKYIVPVLAAAFAAGCTDIEDIQPFGNGYTKAQYLAAIEQAPDLANAPFLSMFTMMGYPNFALGGSRPDDYGYVMMAMSNDLEGADCIIPNSGYNWFSVCGELSSRSANYANPRIRYSTPYNQIKLANDQIRDLRLKADSASNAKVGQCFAVRAFAYEQMAYNFQFLSNLDGPCVPIVTDSTTDYNHNPRATVREVYDLIYRDLDSALVRLDAYNRNSKKFIDKYVVYGLRARADLAMGRYAEAAADAENALKCGLTPATLKEVSEPYFYDIKEQNWMWGVDMTTTVAALYPSATSDSWIRSFSGEGYAAATGCYVQINSMLWNRIPESDIRKGWWVDSKLQSSHLDNLTWNGVKGQAIAKLKIKNVKVAFEPYTNVKFGVAEVGGTACDSDWPLMRVEEMILTQAEGYLKSGNEAKAKEILGNFVKTYRDPEYDVNAYSNLADEIWKQRRIELWGEGFFTFDANRLQKPIVRFHEGEENNMPEAFKFNVAYNDGWRLMRFPQAELNTNYSVVDNTEGSKPTIGQKKKLMDGVTD